MSNKKTVKPFSEKQEKIGSSIIKKYSKFQVFIYRLTGGRLMNKFLGSPVSI